MTVAVIFGIAALGHVYWVLRFSFGPARLHVGERAMLGLIFAILAAVTVMKVVDQIGGG